MQKRIKGKLYRALKNSQMTMDVLREQTIDAPPSNRNHLDSVMDLLLTESENEKEFFYIVGDSKAYSVWDVTEIPPEIIFTLRDDPALSVPVSFESTGKKRPRAMKLEFSTA